MTTSLDREDSNYVLSESSHSVRPEESGGRFRDVSILHLSMAGAHTDIPDRLCMAQVCCNIDRLVVKYVPDRLSSIDASW